MRLLWFVLFGLGLLAAVAWAADFVTLQGERTVYTAECVGGQWQGKQCAGRLVAGERFRFRALKAHKEVLFWTVGSSIPSGKFTDCDIVSGRNWRCKPMPTEAPTITYEMVAGGPVHNAAWKLRPFHAISKWNWYLLDLGLSAGAEVDN
jgi:hypothetical protein